MAKLGFTVSPHPEDRQLTWVTRVRCKLPVCAPGQAQVAGPARGFCDPGRDTLRPGLFKHLPVKEKRLKIAAFLLSD